MKIIITKNYEELSERAAEIMLGVVKQNPRAVLGLATGTTPLGLYAKMISDHRENGTDYAFDSSWKVERAEHVRKNAGMNATEKYGTSRANAFRLFEDCLNQRATTIHDTVIRFLKTNSGL